MKLIDENLINKKFNDWVVLEYSHKVGYAKYYICRCKCGCEKSVYIGNVINGKSKSCGHTNNKLIGERSKKYNEYYIKGTNVYVKFHNTEDEMVCDTDDWEKLKQYCWHKSKQGYCISQINRSPVRFHRLIFNISNKKQQVDHVNGNKLDNRKINLRICNNQENSFNKDKNKNNTSGYKGVYWDGDRNKWRASIQFNGKSIKSPKRYNNPEEAFNWYKDKSDELFGEFSYDIIDK